MTTSRARPTGTRRTRLPVPGCAAAVPGSLPAPPRRGSKRLARAAAAAFAVAVLSAAGLAGRAALAASLTVLGHLHWIWIPVTVVLESASMVAFAIMLRRLLAAGGAKVGVRPMLATALAANALSVSVPLAGPSWPQPLPSAASPGRAPTPRWPAGRCWPAEWSPRQPRPSSWSVAG